MVYKEENNARSMLTHEMIALCHILEDCDIFSKKLVSFLTSKNNRDDLSELYYISSGKTISASKKVKRFYQENQSVIDVFNQYNSIRSFVINNFDKEGIIRKDSCLDLFYRYLVQHKNELDKILVVLQKIDSLGIERIFFDETVEFENSEYKIYTKFEDNYNIEYSDNMVVLPNYQDGIIKYKTTGSNYRIILRVGYLGLDKIDKYDRRIAVNSLLFNPSILPEEITKEAIFDKIVGLKEQQRDNCTAIKDSVDLSVGVDDLYSQFCSMSRIVEQLKNVNDKEELKTILLKIKEHLDKLKDMSVQYDDSISQGDTIITKEILEKEKTLYLERRYWSKIDID